MGENTVEFRIKTVKNEIKSVQLSILSNGFNDGINMCLILALFF